jgi:transposase
MNVLRMDQQETILSLLRLGWGVRRIERETGISRPTIIKYRHAYELGDPKFTTLAPGPILGEVAATQLSRCEPYRAFIESELDKGRNGKAIYQDLVEHHGVGFAYNSLKRFIARRKGRHAAAFCRVETALGEEAQVDYGLGALTRHPKTGKYRRPHLFVMTLSSSRMSYMTVVWESSKATWSRLHEAAFAFFGGAPKLIRLDNLKEGVLSPDIYDPVLNPLYADCLRHYGVMALPCRPYTPNLKGKVESAVGYVQKTALAGRRFDAIEDQIIYLARWNERWASTRIHGTTKRQVREAFAEEKPALQALPTTRFAYYEALERVVHFDAHVEVRGAYYSAPPTYTGRRILVHASELWIRLIDPTTQSLVREHPTTGKGMRVTFDADRPPQTPPSVLRLTQRAEIIGEQCGGFALALERERGALAARALFGLLDLARRYASAAVEEACRFANLAGSTNLRFVRTYLERHHQKRPSLTARHPIIPAIENYQCHFATLTQQGAFSDDQR